MFINLSGLLNLARAIIGQVSAANALKTLATVCANAIRWLARLDTDVANTTWWAGARVGWEWNNALHPNSVAAQGVWRNVGKDVYSISQHLINVVIPNSVRAGASITNIRGGGVLVSQVKALGVRLGKDEGQLHADTSWINATGRPWIAQWIGFISAWPKGGEAAVGALVDFLHHPGNLSRFLAPSMTTDIARRLSTPAARPALDLLERALLAHAPRLVQQIDRAAVAVLSSGNYPTP